MIFSLCLVFIEIVILFSLLFFHKVIFLLKTKPILSSFKKLKLITLTNFSSKCYKSIVTIVIPAFNESNRIENTLRLLLRYMDNSEYLFEVIIIDDGSIDDTFTKIYTFIKDYLTKNHKTVIKFKLVSFHRNYGKGSAIAMGSHLSSSRNVLIMDADCATEIKEIKNFLLNFKESSLICGTRIRKENNMRLVLSKSFSFLTKLLIGFWDIRDSQCGFKMFDKKVIEKVLNNMKFGSWLFDLELIILSKKKGFPICNIPVQWKDKSGSKLRILEDMPSMFIDLCAMSFYYNALSRV